MKKGCIGIIGNPAKSDNSHSYGWNRIVLSYFGIEKDDMLTEKDDWSSYDELYILHGPDYKPGSYNIIGGLNESHINRLDKANNFKGKLYTIDKFDVHDYIEKRKIDYKFTKDIQYIDIPNNQPNLALGDSHILSVWPNSSYNISRNDGKTLFGFLKDPNSYIDRQYNDIILYFGNIDLRFHLIRQDSPVEATHNLFNRYVEFAKSINATIVELLPVEHESRKLPGTGLYKKQKFFGTRKQRMFLRNEANQIMNNSGLKVLKWPEEWVDEEGYKMLDILQPKQSVHIRPKYYYQF